MAPIPQRKLRPRLVLATGVLMALSGAPPMLGWAQETIVPEDRTRQRSIGADEVGTGFAVRGDRILTSGHGVSGCSSISVIPSGTGPVPARLVKLDQARDLALISASMPSPLPSLRLEGTSAPETGTPVYILGFPLQPALRARLHSFYQALVTGPFGIGGDPSFYRLDMVVLPGMSGAAVLDGAGRVVGVVQSHIVVRAPNQGPTLGGQTLVTSGRAAAGFLAEEGLEPETAQSSAPLSISEIAARLIASSVPIRCSK